MHIIFLCIIIENHRADRSDGDEDATDLFVVSKQAMFIFMRENNLT